MTVGKRNNVSRIWKVGREEAAIVLWRWVKDVCCHCVSGTLSLTCWFNLLVWGCTQVHNPQLLPNFLFHIFQFWSRHGVCKTVMRWQIFLFKVGVHTHRWWAAIMGHSVSLLPSFPIPHFTEFVPSSYFRATIRWKGKSLSYKLAHAPAIVERQIATI